MSRRHHRGDEAAAKGLHRCEAGQAGFGAVQNAALHNACVQVPDPQSTVALFVALTRAVREAEVHDDVRIRAYDVIDRMAQTVGQTGCRVELEALAALASEHAQMHLALQPFWDDLLALVPKQ